MLSRLFSWLGLLLAGFVGLCLYSWNDSREGVEPEYAFTQARSNHPGPTERLHRVRAAWAMSIGFSEALNRIGMGSQYARWQVGFRRFGFGKSQPQFRTALFSSDGHYLGDGWAVFRFEGKRSDFQEMTLNFTVSREGIQRILDEDISELGNKLGEAIWQVEEFGSSRLEHADYSLIGQKQRNGEVALTYRYWGVDAFRGKLSWDELLERYESIEHRIWASNWSIRRDFFEGRDARELYATASTSGFQGYSGRCFFQFDQDSPWLAVDFDGTSVAGSGEWIPTFRIPLLNQNEIIMQTKLGQQLVAGTRDVFWEKYEDEFVLRSAHKNIRIATLEDVREIRGLSVPTR